MARRTRGKAPASTVAPAPVEAGPSARAPEETPVEEPEPAPVRRAGGHVDRGDGRGWVPEQED